MTSVAVHLSYLYLPILALPVKSPSEAQPDAYDSYLASSEAPSEALFILFGRRLKGGIL